MLTIQKNIYQTKMEKKGKHLEREHLMTFRKKRKKKREIRRNINYAIKKPGAASGASQDSTCPVTKPL